MKTRCAKCKIPTDEKALARIISPADKARFRAEAQPRLTLCVKTTANNEQQQLGAVASGDGLGGGKYPDSYYLRCDPFEGDRDTDVKMQTVSIVKVRKERDCWMGLSPDNKPHKIKAGERARYERALVDGAWCGYYVCLHCIDAWLKDVCGEPPNE